MVNENELKSAVNSLCSRYGIQGVLLYLDGNKVKVAGELDISALTPLLLKAAMSKLGV